MTDRYQKFICRLCAKHDYCTDIFSKSGMNQSLSYMINTCLPFQVTKDDELSKRVCFSCIQKLNVAFELISTAVVVQSKLDHARNNSVSQSSSEQAEVTSSASSGMSPVCERPHHASTLKMLLQTEPKLVKMQNTGKANDDKISPVICSVQTLASGPTPTFDSCDRPSKERKTVCRHCRQWYPLSKIKEHEATHHHNKNVVMLATQAIND